MLGIALAVALVASGARTAIAYETPNTAFAGGTSTMTGSGLTQTWTATGATSLAGAATTAGSKSSPTTTSYFSPAIAATTPSQSVQTVVDACTTTGTCTGLGTLTVTFGHPVQNPVIHVAGLGGALGTTIFHATLTAKNGVALTSIGSGNAKIASNAGASMITAAAESTSNLCNSLGTAGATQNAVCGSFQVSGTVTQVGFDIGAYTTAGLTGTGNIDEYLVFATVDQDYGDAPSAYDGGNAARAVTSDIRLGATVSNDNTATLNATTSPYGGVAGATGDSDDGVTLGTLATVATTYSAAVTMSGVSAAGQVCGWVDFNKNSTFDAGERACQAVSVGQTSATLTWSGLSGLTAGNTYARFRIGYNTTQTQTATGASDSGEVEDYALTIVALATPVATPDTPSTTQGSPVTFNPLTNDTVDPRTTLNPSSVKLRDPATGTYGTSVTIPGQGTYTVDTGTGTVTFTPLPTFTGTATAVTYQVADQYGQVASSTITVTVAPVTPAPVNDTASTAFNTPTTVALLSNDAPGNAGVPLVVSSVKLLDPATGTYGTSVTIPGQGTYAVDASGVVTFTPDALYHGTATPITYRVADSNGTTATATLTVTVGPPPSPAPADDSATTPQGVAVTLSTLTNDALSSAGAALVPSSVVIKDPVAGTYSTSVTVAGQGTWTVDTATGNVTMTPVPGFSGTATAITYRVTDTNGATATAVEHVTVTPVTPTAAVDSASTAYETPVAVTVLANDAPGNAGVPLVPASVQLKDPADGTYKTSVTVAGVGTYVVQAGGSVVFTPAQGYSGVTPQLDYRVADTNGTYATSTMSITVALPPAPAAAYDEAITLQNVPVTVHPLANDSSDPSSPLDPTSVTLVNSLGNPVSSLTVPGEGTYTVNATTGDVTFTPVAGFSGTATPVTYRVKDESGQTTSSTIGITVTAVTPTAASDSASTPYGHPVTIPVLVNDASGGASAPLVVGSVQLQDPVGGTWKTSVTVAGVGTYAAQPDGSVLFTPAPGFEGTPAAMPYRVADTNGTYAASTVSVAVGSSPKATDDSTTTLQGLPVTLTTLSNDTSDAAAPLNAASVTLLDPVSHTQTTTVTVAGQGTWTVNTANGNVTFTPLATFHGTATPITYTVADANGSTTQASEHVTVTQVTPSAAQDSGSTAYETPVTVAVLGNDSAGDPLVPLNTASLQLQDPADGTYKATVTVASVGTYVVQPDHTVTFTPAQGYTGITPQLGYHVADANGTYVTSTLSVTVSAPTPPVAVFDTATTPQGVPVTLDTLSNDTSDPAAPLNPASVAILDPATSTYKTTVTIPGEGTYVVNPADGKVTFTPVPSFSGDATSLTYHVADEAGQVTIATIAVTVNAITPTATADSATTPYLHPVTIALLSNDSSGGASAPLVPSTVRLQDPVGGAWKTSVTVAGVGTYVVQPDGSVIFTPAAGYHGTTPALPYRVADTNGTIAASTVVVTVDQAPLAATDTATTPQGIAVTVDPLANDTPGTGGTFVVGSVLLQDPADSAWKTSVTVPGQGTYTVDTSTGHVEFAPVPAFHGTATAIPYSVVDSYGNTTSSTIAVDVTSVVPTAAVDTTTTPYETSVTVPVLSNDAAGNPLVALVPASVQLRDPADNGWKTTVTLPGVGTYIVQPDGSVAFAPAQGYTGTTVAVPYRVADANGTLATSSVAVTVSAPPAPVAVPDSTTTPQGVPVTVAVLGNDSSDPAAPLNAASVALLDPATSTYKASVTIPGEGTYVVNPADGKVTFTPVASFTGVATPVTYHVADEAGQLATATLTVTVDTITPTAAPDTATTPYLHPVTIPLLSTDAAGAPSAPLVAASVTLKDPADGTWKSTVTVAGVGSYAVQADGSVLFTPAAGFSGTPTPMPYRVADTNGTYATSTVAPTVGAAPKANDDSTTTLQGIAVTLTTLSNDTSDAAAPLNPASVTLLDPATSTQVTTLTVAGQGTWTVNPAGDITFAPLPTFHGTATPITYTVADANGATSQAVEHVTVTQVTPTASVDTSTTPYETPVTVTVLGNDSPGDPAVALNPSSVQLQDPADSGWKSSVTLPGVGTYAVQPDGSVVFTPVQGYTGTTVAVPYRVADANGTLAASTVAVTVNNPAAPVANPDTAHTPQGVEKIIDPLANDTFDAAAPVSPANVTLYDPINLRFRRTVVMPGEGTYTVDPVTAHVTFTPLPTFVGTATPVTYEIIDEAGQVATSTITITVDPVIPTATVDTASTPYEHAVTVPLLANDAEGAATAPLDPSSVQLQDPADGTWKTSVTVAGVGSYAVQADGSVVFTPAAGYQGSTAALPYRVADANGTLAQSTVTVTVRTAPAASPDSATTLQGQPKTVNPLGNDVPGGTSSIVATSVLLLDPADGTYKPSVTIPGQGTWAADPVTGAVTFSPVPTFTGPAAPVTYRYSDSDGNTASSTISVDVTPVTPLALPDNGSTPFSHAVAVPLVANDTPGAPVVPLVPASVQLKDPVTGMWATTVPVAGVGSYAVQPDGSVEFTPESTFSGSAPALTYRVADANGTYASSTVSVVVGAAPVAANDPATTLQNTPVTLDPLTNDLPGTGASLVVSSVELLDPSTGTYATTVTIPGEGTYEVVSGQVTFTPVASFSGPATPVSYRVLDTDGNAANAQLAVTVTAIVPELLADAVATPFEQPVTVDVLGNDLPGHPSAPLVPGSVQVLDPADSTWKTSVTIPGQGTFDVEPDGKVQFTPAAGYEGDVTTVSYRVADTNGSLATSTLHVFIGDAPVAAPDTATTPQGKPVVLPLLANDAPGTGATLQPGTTQLLDPATHTLKSSVTVAGEGTWTVDPATGAVTFAPLPGFVGTTAAMTYQVNDSNGTDATSTATVTVTPVVPVAAPDTASTAFRTPVELTVLSNDAPGRADTPLNPGTVELQDPATGTWSTSVTVDGVGTWSVTTEGTVVFTPEATFDGTTAALPYRVADSNGTYAPSTLRVTVNPPYGAAADPDTSVGSPGVPVVVNPLLNDAPSHGATWLESSVCLVPDSAKKVTGLATTSCPKTASVAGMGTWTVNPDGTITFVPEAGFTGSAAIGYSVTDTNGVVVANTATITIKALPNTGGPALAVGLVGLVLVGVGGLVLLLGRRRRRSEA